MEMRKLVTQWKSNARKECADGTRSPIYATDGLTPCFRPPAEQYAEPRKQPKNA